MLSSDHIFVKLTRKYCHVKVIKDEIIIAMANNFLVSNSDAISQLIKTGNYKYYEYSKVYFQDIGNGNGYTAACGICDNHSIKIGLSKRLAFSFETEYHGCGILDNCVVWDNCIGQVYSYFNQVVNKLGREEFKKLYHKFFIFMHNENIVLDLCYNIGKTYILSNL